MKCSLAGVGGEVVGESSGQVEFTALLYEGEEEGEMTLAGQQAQELLRGTETNHVIQNSCSGETVLQLHCHQYTSIAGLPL